MAFPLDSVLLRKEKIGAKFNTVVVLSVAENNSCYKLRTMGTLFSVTGI